MKALFMLHYIMPVEYPLYISTRIQKIVKNPENRKIPLKPFLIMICLVDKVLSKEKELVLEEGSREGM
jgi:hypothetical protein